MQKGFTGIYVFIGILVLGAIGGAYYFGKSQVAKPQTQNQVVSQTPLPVVSTKPASSDETANLKTYTDLSQGMEFRYPGSWKIVPRKDDKSSLELQSSDYLSKIASKEEPDLFINKGVVIFFPPSIPYTNSFENLLDIRIPLNNFLIKNIDGLIIEKSIKLKSGSNYKAIEAESTIQLGAQYQISKYIFIPINEKLFTIKMVYIKGQELHYKETFDKILSTFKFLDQPLSSTSPETISTLTNQACGGPLAVEPNSGCPQGFHCGNVKTIGGETSGNCIKN